MRESSSLQAKEAYNCFNTSELLDQETDSWLASMLSKFFLV